MESPFRRPTSRERRRDLTRARLYDAAIEEFRHEGFDGASIARIAKRAGVSRASFYFHYPTREHVLLELQWNLELRVVERLKDREPLHAALLEFVDGMIEAAKSVGDPALYREMLRIYTRRPEGLMLDDQPFPLMMALAKLFAQGAQDGELRSDLEPAQATHLFLTSVFGYLIASSVPTESMRADLEVLIGLFLRQESS